MMLLYSPALAAIPVVTVAVYAILRSLRFASLRAASLGQMMRYGAQQSLFLESLRGIQAIKLFNNQATRLARYMKLVVDTANCDVQVQRLGQFFEAANGTLLAVESGLILWVGGHAVLGASFTVGMLMAFLSYKTQFSARVTSLIDKVIDLRMLRLQSERLADIVLSKPEAEPVLPYLSAQEVVPSLELRNVSFRYAETEPWVIQRFSMRVEPGESVVLVGPSGCGKTTLLKILLGQLAPQVGEVLVGGVPLQQLGVGRFLDMAGVVMQNDQLFAGTLAENISFFDEQCDPARVERCAALAQVHEDIRLMPMGYNSLVGDMGTTLSGGQKQRILLARALYKQPEILFLDEATSHLDGALETSIAGAIAGLAMTRVVIAHRQETIRAGGRQIQVGPISAQLQGETKTASYHERQHESAGDPRQMRPGLGV